MKQHTNQLKQNVKQHGREIDSIITYGNTTLHDELYAVTPLFEGNILKSVMKQLDILSSVDIPIDTILNYQLGIKVGDAYEYLNFGNYVVVKSEKQEDTNKYKITCYDKMVYSMKQNEELQITYPITIKNYLIAVANKIGLTVKDTGYYNKNLYIAQELYVGLDYTYRDILDEIAQATGSTIIINTDDQIELKYPNTTGDTINEEFLKDVNVNFAEKYGPINAIVLSRAGESDNIYIRDNESVQQNGLCEVKIVDNQIMNWNDRADYLEGLLAALDGLEYYINNFSSTGICYYDILDMYNIQIGENTYQCLMLNDEINITSGIEELIHTDMPEQSETDYEKADKTDRRLNQTYIIVDKQNQTIESVVSNVTEQNNKISQITQTVDEINAKISDVIDITTTAESTSAQVQLEKINESEPILLRVHPIVTNISYLYPRNNLYPMSNLYMPTRIIRFTRTYQEEGKTYTEKIYYELPDDLLYYDSENYDEFYLDYDSQTCQITKKCKYNADGTVSLLAIPTIETYEYPLIELGSGDYEVSILGYATGYIKVTLMSENIYTTQYYTKVEVNSRLSTVANEINLNVNQKMEAIDGEITEIKGDLSLKIDKTDNNQIVSMLNASADIITLAGGSSINLTTPGKLIISAGNFILDSYGNITATNANIVGNLKVMNNNNIEIYFSNQRKAINLDNNGLDFFADDGQHIGALWSSTTGGTRVMDISFTRGRKFAVSSEYNGNYNTLFTIDDNRAYFNAIPSISGTYTGDIIIGDFRYIFQNGLLKEVRIV